MCINTSSEFSTLIKEIIITFMILFCKEILKLNNIFFLEFYYYPRNSRFQRTFCTLEFFNVNSLIIISVIAVYFNTF